MTFTYAYIPLGSHVLVDVVYVVHIANFSVGGHMIINDVMIERREKKIIERTQSGRR